MSNKMSDLEFSENAQRCMNAHRYDDAIEYLRKMENNIISIKMELLVIEHELGNIKKK